MAAEVPYLVQRVPSSHLHDDFAVYIRDRHGDVKEMLLRVRQGHFITDGSEGRATACREKK
jgi:hypothetical protein